MTKRMSQNTNNDGRIDDFTETGAIFEGDQSMSRDEQISQTRDLF
jgi:hypothetical protein